MTPCRKCNYRLKGNPEDPYFCLIYSPCIDDPEDIRGRKVVFWNNTIKDILCGKVNCESFVEYGKMPTSKSG